MKLKRVFIEFVGEAWANDALRDEQPTVFRSALLASDICEEMFWRAIEDLERIAGLRAAEPAPTFADCLGSSKTQLVLRCGTLHHINNGTPSPLGGNVRAYGFENVRLMKRRARSLVALVPKGGARPAAVIRATTHDDKQRVSAVFAIMIIALLFQSLITGSHIHASARFGPSGNPGLAASTSLSYESPSKSGECAICREIAQARHYVASTPPHLTFGALPGFWLSPVVPRPITRHSLSHAWHSRGPPQAAPF